MARTDYKKPDYYSRKAKEKGYPARSVFKLSEIAGEERLLRPGMAVLDLGASPGSWMQYCSEEVGPRGVVVGVDINPLGRSLRPNERFLPANALEVSAEELRGELPGFDVVLSDMMPATTGMKDTDHYRSLALAERAWALAQVLLKAGGHFLVKVFQGPGADAFRQELMRNFRKFKVKKPKSSRPNSREVYYLGISFIKKERGDGEKSEVGSSREKEDL